MMVMDELFHVRGLSGHNHPSILLPYTVSFLQLVSTGWKTEFYLSQIQAYSITKGIFYPSFFIMKLFDKTTEYCQCVFEAKYLDNMDFILS